MDNTYEIFKKLHDGPMWIETVTGLEQSKQRLASLNKAKPGEFFIYDIREARIVAELSCDPESDLNADQRQQRNAPEKESHVGLSYEVFKQNEDGERVWVETVFGLNALETRLMKLSSLRPGTYMVYDTTERKFVEPFKKTA